MKKFKQVSNVIIIYSLATFITIASLRGSKIFFELPNKLTKPFVLIYDAADAIKDGHWSDWILKFKHPQRIKYTKTTVNKLEEDLFIAKVDLNNKLIIRNLRLDLTVAEVNLTELCSFQIEDFNNPKIARYSSDLFGLTYEGKNFALLINLFNNQVQKVILPGTSHHTTEFFGDNLMVMVRRQIPKIASSKNPVSKNFYKHINDEGYVLINKEGEITKTFWISSILDDIREKRNIHSLVHHTWAEADPFHLNDVEIITSSKKITDSSSTFQIADVLISSRNMSAIFHLRHDKLLNIYTGQFNFQHDVDFVSGDTISIFNNNSGGSYVGLSNPSTCLTILSPKNNYEKNHFNDRGLNTVNQGKYSLTNGEYHVFENQNQHEYLIFKDSTLVFQGPFWIDKDDSIALIPSWDVFYQ